MADTTDKLIRIIFEGESRIGGTIGTIQSALVDNIQKPLVEVGNKVIDLDKKLALLAAGGLAYSFAEAVKLESAVVGLDKVLSEQEQKLLPDLVKRMEEFGGAFGQTTADAVNAAAEFRKASFELEASAHLAELASKLVIGAGEANFDMGRSTETLISILKGFKVESEDIVETSSHMADVLNKLADEYATTVGELSNGLTILAPIADGLGYSFDEMAGLLIPVIEIFGSGSESANGLKTSLLSLADPTKEVTRQLDAYGIALLDANGKQKDVKQILNELLPVYNALDKSQQVQLASMIAGKDQAAKFSALLNGMNTALTATTIAAGDAGGSLEKELTRGLGTAEVQIKRAIASFRDLAAAIGTQFINSGKSAIEGATDINLALKALAREGAFNEILGLVSQTGNELGELFKNIAKNLPEAFKDVDFGGLIESLQSFKEEILTTFDFDLSTTEGLTSAIQLVVDAFESLINVSSGMYDAFKPYIQGIVEAIERSDEISAETEKSIGRIIGISGLIGELGVALGGVVVTLNQAGVTVKGTFDVIIGSSNALYNTVQLIFDGIAFFIIALTDALISSSELLNKLNPFDNFDESLKNARRGIEELKQANYYSIKENLEEIFDGSAQSVDGFNNKIKDTQIELDKISKPKKIDIEIDYDAILEKAKLDFEQEKIPIGVRISEEDARNEIANIVNLFESGDFEGVEIKLKIEADEIEFANNKLRETTDFMRYIRNENRLILSDAEQALSDAESNLNVVQSTISELLDRKQAIEIDIETRGTQATPRPLIDELDDINRQLSSLSDYEVQVKADLEPLRREVAKATNDLDKMKDVIVTEIGGETYIEFIGEIKNEETIKEKKDKLSEDRKFVLEIENKRFEEETKRITAQIESDSEVLQKALEFEAKIKIAQFESDAKRIESVLSSTGELIQGLSDSSADLFSQFSQDLKPTALWLLEDQIRQNLRIQGQEFELRKKSIELENEYMRIRNEKLKDDKFGEVKITLDEKINYALKAVLIEIIGYVQAEANLEFREALIEAA